MSNTNEEAHWYVVHTYSGYENKVKDSLDKMVKNRNMEDVILEIKIPTEDTVEIKNGKRKTVTRKLYPGYVLVKMLLTDQAWYVVRNTRGVTGFISGSVGADSAKPIPLSDDEIRALNVEFIPIEMDIQVGETVRVISGPLESFMGQIESVDQELQKVRVSVSMFGRETPVDLDFTQIQKL